MAEDTGKQGYYGAGKGLKRVQAVAVSSRIDLGGNDGKGTLGHCGIIGGQFLAHDLKARHGVLHRSFGDIDQVEQQGGAFDMAEKLNAQALAFVRAFDEPRNVGDDETAILGIPHHAQIRHKRGKGIVRNFGRAAKSPRLGSIFRHSEIQ